MNHEIEENWFEQKSLPLPRHIQSVVKRSSSGCQAMRRANLTRFATKGQRSSLTKVRLRILFPHCYRQEPVLSRLVSDHALIFNITQARLDINSQENGQLDLELQGTTAQIGCGLAYLESLNLKIIGKPNPDGDSWHY
jgi:ABC-type methionine transport system ATPase subunit